MSVHGLRRELRLLALLGPLEPAERRALGWVTAALAGAALLRLPVPVISQTLIDRVIAGGRLELLPVLAGALAAASLAQLLLHVGRGRRLAALRERMTARLHHRVVRHLLRLQLTTLVERTPGYLAARASGDATAAGRLLSDAVLRLVLDALTLVLGLGLMAHYEPGLALLAAALVPLHARAVLRYGEAVRAGSRRALEAGAEAQRELLDLVRNVPLAHLNDAADHLARRHERAWDRGVRARLELADLLVRSTGVSVFLAGLAPLLVLVVGGLEAAAGKLTVGELVAFLGLVGYVFHPVQRTVGTRLEVRRALAALERIEELLRLPCRPRARGGRRVLSAPLGRLEVRAVRFAYPGAGEVLRGVTFEAGPCELVALTGPSGSGKTTLLWLVAGLLDPTGGSVLLDGIDLRELEPASLRSAVTMVPQPAMLLDGTVRDNIVLGRQGYTDAEVALAAERANAMEFIRRLPQGLDTPVGEGGARLSGGQAQRIALARALLRPARVVLLDEPSTHLDRSSREALHQALAALRTERTVLVVTHDRDLLGLADRVVVLDHGRTTGPGPERAAAPLPLDPVVDRRG